MTEQELRWSISRCNNTINELKERLKKKKADLEELEDFEHEMAAVANRLQASRDSAVRKIGGGISAIIAAIKGAIFDDMRSCVDGPAFEAAMSGANSTVADARRKALEIADEIDEIEREIRRKEQQRSNFYYQLNHLDEEG